MKKHMNFKTLWLKQGQCQNPLKQTRRQRSGWLCLIRLCLSLCSAEDLVGFLGYTCSWCRWGMWAILLCVTGFYPKPREILVCWKTCDLRSLAVPHLLILRGVSHGISPWWCGKDLGHLAAWERLAKRGLREMRSLLLQGEVDHGGIQMVPSHWQENEEEFSWVVKYLLGLKRSWGKA